MEPVRPWSALLVITCSWAQQIKEQINIQKTAASIVLSPKRSWLIVKELESW